VSPADCEATSDSFPDATAGVAHVVTVVSRDEFGNQLIAGGLNATIQADAVDVPSFNESVALTPVTDANDGTYVAEFNLANVGSWAIDVKFVGSVGGAFQRDDHNFKIVAGELDLTKTQVNGVGTYAPGPYTAGTVYSQFTIVFFDAGGNKRYTSTDLSDGTLALVLTDGYDSEHAVSHAETYYPESSTGDDTMKKGMFYVNFTSTHAGSLAITFVTNTGEPLVNKVTGSPWEATVNPGDPVASKTKVYGGGVGVAAMGQANVVNIRAADANGNPYTVKPAGGHRVQVRLLHSRRGRSVRSRNIDAIHRVLRRWRVLDILHPAQSHAGVLRQGCGHGERGSGGPGGAHGVGVRGGDAQRVQVHSAEQVPRAAGVRRRERPRFPRGRHQSHIARGEGYERRAEGSYLR